MKWPPAQGIGGGALAATAAGRKTNELLLITGSQGSFYLYGKGNRLEKTVQAHQGRSKVNTILVLREWSKFCGGIA